MITSQANPLVRGLTTAVTFTRPPAVSLDILFRIVGSLTPKALAMDALLVRPSSCRQRRIDRSRSPRSSRVRAVDDDVTWWPIGFRTFASRDLLVVPVTETVTRRFRIHKTLRQVTGMFRR